MSRRRYTRTTTTTAEGSQKPTFKQYGLTSPACAGCGRKIVAAHEPALWFTGYPTRAVFAPCCFHLAVKA